MTVVWPRVTVMKSREPVKPLKGKWQKVDGRWKFILDPEPASLSITQDERGHYRLPV